MAGGELAAVFKGLAEDADQAAGNIAESVAKFGEQTAEKEEGNLARTLDSEAQNAKSFTDIAEGDAGVHEPAVTPESAPPTPSGEPSAPGEPFREPTTPSGDDGIAGNNDVPAENSQPTESVPKSRDPIDFSTGRVLLDQVDLELPGALPLRLTRCHRSTLRVGRWFGRTWSSTMDQRVEVTGDAVHFVAADGMLLKYPLPGDDGSAVLPVLGAPWPLRRTADGYAITDPGSHQTLHFTATAPDRAPITSIGDRNGNRVDFAYDERGMLTEISHSGGYRVAVETAGGLITELRVRMPDAPDVIVQRYRYNSARQLTEVVGPTGRPTVFEYDADGRLVRWEDTNGMWYRYAYDADGRCVHAEGRDGYLSATVAYDRQNLVTTATNALGHTTTYQLNERLQVIRETDPLGNTRTFEWDRHHRLRSGTDALGRTTRYEYDAAGHIVRAVRPDGHEITIERNALGLPVTVTEPGGVVWRHEYDERGNRTAQTDPTGARTRYEYDERGHLRRIVDALGRVGLAEYDAAGLPVRTTDPAGGVTVLERDGFGRLSTLRDPVAGVTRFRWSVEGKLLSRTLPDGSTEQWSHDGEGNALRRVDALGQVTHVEFGHFDVPVAETGPDGARTEFTYDAELHTVAVRNPDGLVWRYEYDAAGRLAGEVDFNGRPMRYGYDAAGQLSRQQIADGPVTQYVRDPLGLVVEQHTGETVTAFGYDAVGRVIRAVGPDADVRFERDPLGRILAETVNGRTVTSGYDQVGRRVLRRTPSGTETVWSYDENDRPVGCRLGEHVLSMGYDAAGREVERHFGAATLTQTWDGNDRLRTQVLTSRFPGLPHRGPQVVHRRSYAYRADGYLTRILDLSAQPQEFDLDQAGRIRAVHEGDRTERYGYDRSGNVTTSGDVRYSHDAQGRVVLRQHKRLSRKPDTWRYTWDGDDNLVGVTTPDGRQWRHRYDPFGRRIAKQLLAADGTTVVEQVDFVWDDTVLVEQATLHGPELILRDITTWDYEPGTFRPVCQAVRRFPPGTPQHQYDVEFYAIVADLVGTPTELVDESGIVVWRRRATVWGVPRTAEGGGPSCPLRFPGQYHDPESGLHYNRHRYYDPATGRYLSDDPLGLDGGPNPSGYVPNPTAWIDPFGLTPCPLGQYADTLRGENQAATPRVAAEYTSPSGAKYYAHSREGVPIPDELRGEMEQVAPLSNRHGACAEVNALSKAVDAEGPGALRGGSMRAVRVRPINSGGTAHGTSIDPCEPYCQPLLARLGIRW